MTIGIYEPVFRTKEVDTPAELRSAGFPEKCYAEVWNADGSFGVGIMPQFYHARRGYPTDIHPRPQFFHGPDGRQNAIETANAMIEDLSSWKIGTL